MSEYRVMLSDGQTILLEGSVPRAEQEVVNRRREAYLRDVLPQITSFCRDISGALSQVVPDRISITFGIRFSVETSGMVAIITKGGAETTLEVTLEGSPGESDPHNVDGDESDDESDTEAV